MDENTEINLTLNTNNGRTTQKTTVVSSDVGDVRDLLDKLATPEEPVDLGFGTDPMKPNDFMPYGDEVADMSAPIEPEIDDGTEVSRFDYEPESAMDIDHPLGARQDAPMDIEPEVAPEESIMDLNIEDGNMTMDYEPEVEAGEEILLEPEDEYSIFSMAEGIFNRKKNKIPDYGKVVTEPSHYRASNNAKDVTHGRQKESSANRDEVLAYALKALQWVGNGRAALEQVSNKYGDVAADSIESELMKLDNNQVRSYQRFHDSIQKTLYADYYLNESWGESDTSSAIDAMRHSIESSGGANPNSIMNAAEEAANVYASHMGFKSLSEASDFLAALYMQRELPGTTDLIPSPKFSQDRLAMEGIVDFARNTSNAVKGVTSGPYPIRVAHSIMGKTKQKTLWSAKGFDSFVNNYGLQNEAEEIMNTLLSGRDWTNPSGSMKMSSSAGEANADIDEDADFDYRDKKVKKANSYNRETDLGDFARQGHAKRNMKRGGKGDNILPESTEIMNEWVQFKKKH